MPQISINYTAINHNLRIMQECSKAWNFRWLPVLKMVAGYPPIADLVRENGFSDIGIADVDEHLCFGRMPEPSQSIYINIVPPYRIKDILKRFKRSSVSSAETLLLLEKEAHNLRTDHSVLLMIDLGDGREGVSQGNEFAELLDFLKKNPLKHIQISGVGVTLGCLNGLCPDNDLMYELLGMLKKIKPFIHAKTAICSLGGSIFWNWYAQNHAEFQNALPDGWQIELRMGDPLLVGFDMYRNEKFPGADFQRNIFKIRAQVLEIHTKQIPSKGIHVNNGHGISFHDTSNKTHIQALLDCGSLHTDISRIIPELAGAKLINYSGNYAILDITDCQAPPRHGDFISFIPDYWAVAKAFRTPQLIKT